MEENLPNFVNEISQADWEKTPESVKQWVRDWNGRIEQVERQCEALKAENQLLKEQLQQNSRNSSKPPSQDRGKGFKGKAEKLGKKKAGGQPGHEGHERPLYPLEQCQSVREHYPETCVECGAALTGSDSQPYRIQIVEVPKVKPQVSEHRFHCLCCQRCGCLTRAWEEEMIHGSGYGARVVAHVAVLSGQYRQSHRMVCELMDEFFGVKLSVGSINRLRQESSAALAEVVQHAHQYVQNQGQVNMDETSFAQGNGDGKNPSRRKGWLWVLVTPLVSYFAVALGRSQAVCQQLLGDAFNGIVNSDRFSAYNGLKIEGR
jgi:transposase